MATPCVDVQFSKFTGTLSLLEHGAEIRLSRESDSDPWLVFDVDQHGKIVGLQLALAQDLSADDWLRHPDRALLPDALRQTMDDWYQQRPPNLQVAIDDPEKMASLFASAGRELGEFQGSCC